MRERQRIAIARAVRGASRNNGDAGELLQFDLRPARHVPQERPFRIDMTLLHYAVGASQ
ncbi:hypothetical protein [Paenibacillus lautus]|uniref:hypothetical protein n=1 Tax=Paenibacillus lautus TaxID=1401 RepID=UPI001C11B98B|nr:hypothetical protein [Paenibacillus lautus]MBU5348275.1 hypothetical protein [Paenibacillus lautus]